MKTILTAFLFAVATICFGVSYGQEITEENYLKVDSTLWDNYGKDINNIMAALRANPEKRDSLMAVSKSLYQNATRINEELAIRYASVPSGLQRVFMVRLDIPKDTLRAVLGRIPEEMRLSPYGRSIARHIETQQIEPGSQYQDFEGFQINGTPFRLSSLIGRTNILLLYGGLDCMGNQGRNFMADLYQKTSRDGLEIVIYCPVSTADGLRKMKEAFPVDYLLISDFLEDHTPFKIIYGAQARPTCFLIDREGSVILKSLGLPNEELSEYLEQGFFQ